MREIHDLDVIIYKKPGVEEKSPLAAPQDTDK